MSAEFIDTNVLIYAHDRTAGRKQEQAAELLTRLFVERARAVSIQVLAEFYSAATRKLALTSAAAEEILADMAAWNIHRPSHQDLIAAVRVQRRYKINWWDALIVTSAIELECSVLWSEDLSQGQQYGALTVRNPFL